ncbi:MAG: CopD family protein [Pseudomonadota bacterium]|nr:CopD family protein [Pseudomonadota bacterium]
MYFWLKFFHIAAMAVWFTGLFFLPRLFVARHRGDADGVQDHFVPTAGMLYFRIMSPAGLVTIALGTVLIAFGPTGGWLVLKLAVVAMAVVIHLYLGVVMYELEQGRDRHGAGFYRMLGWIPLLLLLAVAGLTGAKPDTVPPLPPPPLHDAQLR